MGHLSVEKNKQSGQMEDPGQCAGRGTAAQANTGAGVWAGFQAVSVFRGVRRLSSFGRVVVDEVVRPVK